MSSIHIHYMDIACIGSQTESTFSDHRGKISISGSPGKGFRNSSQCFFDQFLFDDDSLYLESEKDSYGDFNIGLKLLIRYP